MYIVIILIFILLLFYFNDKGVPIFLYHQVNDLSSVTPKLFEEHLKIIKKMGMETLTISEFGERKKSTKTMLITFDDGYYDNYKIVFPLLKKYNMKATIFLNTLFIDDTTTGERKIKISKTANYEAVLNYKKNGNGKTLQYMTWQEIKEMKESGLIEFQAHSHKHSPIFSSDKLIGIYEKNPEDMSEAFLYGDVLEGYPEFSKRGEYSTKGIIIDRKFFSIFKKYYDENLRKKSKKEMLKLGEKFVQENKSNFFFYENDRDFFERVEKDFDENRREIEQKLGTKVEYFCWPWGHRNKDVIKFLKKKGIKGFVTTKKGTNSRNSNLEMIRRIELRDFTPKKFRVNLLIGKNYILGKIYGWLS